MFKPLISIIMPTYNQAGFIQEAIASVLAQTYAHWELIIINNFSDDDTVRVVEAFQDSRISLINYRNHGIIAAARNQGLQQAKGDLIAFLDSDDLWLPTKLERQVQAFAKNENLIVIATNYQEFPIGRSDVLKLNQDKPVGLNWMISHNRLANSAVMMQKKVLAEIGFIDETPGLKTVEDYDYWLKIIDTYGDNSVMILKDILMRYRLHQQNATAVIGQQSLAKFKRLNLIFSKYTKGKLSTKILIFYVRLRIILGIILHKI
jgi:glycosyltransferase involved in cell wall biosynthesis